MGRYWEKLPVHYTVSGSIWLFLICFSFTRVKLDQTLASLDRIQNRLQNSKSSVVGRIIHLSQWFHTACLSLFSRYFHSNCSDEFHSLVPIVKIFTARIYHATFMGSNHCHFLRFTNVRRKLFFVQELLFCATNSCLGASMKYNLNLSSYGSIVIFRHNVNSYHRLSYL